MQFHHSELYLLGDRTSVVDGYEYRMTTIWTLDWGLNLISVWEIACLHILPWSEDISFWLILWGDTIAVWINWGRWRRRVPNVRGSVFRNLMLRVCWGELLLWWNLVITKVKQVLDFGIFFFLDLVIFNRCFLCL